MIEFLAGIASRTSALAARLTAPRAANLDNLDAAISAISPVHSIQYGLITLTGVVSGTATITAVTTAKTVLILLGTRTPDAATIRDVSVEITLTNSTTVTATREGNSGTVYVRFAVLELK